MFLSLPERERPSGVPEPFGTALGNKLPSLASNERPACDTHLELSGFAPGKVFEVEGTFEDMLHNRPMQDKSQEANAFLNRYHGKRLAILELGIGSRNRLIKLPLMQLAAREPQAVYITLNLAQELYIPNEIAHKSIGLAGDIAVTLQKLKEKLV